MWRPFLDDGVPPHFRAYDRGFLHWLAKRHRAVDYLADDDFKRIGSGDRLARLYDLVVFPGHEEYVTTHAYDVLERFRNLGGNLAFLSANNVFYRVERRGRWLVRTGRWRDLGRPEAALVGVEYLRWNENRYRNAPYVVTGTQRAPWLFAGTGLQNGDRFGSFGIEVDTRTANSPRSVRVLARIPDVFGTGRSAEMTYYTTPRGAKVFAAGTEPADLVRARLVEEIPMQRIGTVDDIASVVALLVSPRGRYVTGTSIPVDGGLLRALR
jgi:hypothetical protein